MGELHQGKLLHAWRKKREEAFVKKYLGQKTWYHATTESALPYLAEGIDPEHNKEQELDFGYGFYLTSSLEEARSFAMNLKKATEEMEGKAEVEERRVVVEYEIPLSLEEAAASGYDVKIFPAATAEFYDFVFFNRTKNAFSQYQHTHDMVFGDMANANPIFLVAAWRAKADGFEDERQVKEAMDVFENFKQLSIHNQEICDKINKIKVFDAETGRELHGNGKSAEK